MITEMLGGAGMGDERFLTAGETHRSDVSASTLEQAMYRWDGNQKMKGVPRHILGWFA